ncbi:MAG TPA: cytochrome c oxidase assembly protein [Polyangiales bacterium]|nr:cytochrome c oxidase assembly protein [Polyangiales bacterium]
MRWPMFSTGCAVLALVWLGPMDKLAPGPFAAHMTMHMGVVAIAAPLLAFAVAGGPYDPARRWPWLFPPLPASVLELIAVWSWHAPGPHMFARSTLTGLVLEQTTFLVTGLVLWLAAFGGDVSRRVERSAGGGVALLLTSMHMTLLGALLALPPRALYAHHAHHMHGDLTPLEDQHLGGAIMLVIGGLVYLVGGLMLAAQLLKRIHAERLR